ncbi:hypothetical protein BDZ94DRAFT_892676 [Collybia nuda]|uniref:Uncharacterized protein n=1 Tax=Collybia nuda TaxID=64659 RepID=A0A9P6CH76_9AGAR|nr:hypothetical protein BDZ94DRAFT_892676 [Collybia nuda]
MSAPKQEPYDLDPELLPWNSISFPRMGGGLYYTSSHTFEKSTTTTHTENREIFIYCSDRNPTILPPNYNSGPRFPWTLGQVSSHWREVLRETPNVWRNLEIATVHSQTDATIEAAVNILSRLNTGVRLTIGAEIDVFNPISTLVLGFTERLSHLSI